MGYGFAQMAETESAEGTAVALNGTLQFWHQIYADVPSHSGSISIAQGWSWLSEVRLVIHRDRCPGLHVHPGRRDHDAGHIVGGFGDSTGFRHGFLKPASSFTQLDVPSATVFTGGHRDQGRRPNDGGLFE
jgi:hypothetical protein